MSTENIVILILCVVLIVARIALAFNEDTK